VVKNKRTLIYQIMMIDWDYYEYDYDVVVDY